MREFLRGVLTRNGLSAPDGRALYAYDVSDDDLAALRDLLLRHARRAARFDRFQAAGFCLHAAYAFCERHVDGSWAWATATDPIGVEPTQAVVAELTEEGLAWWRRRVLPVNDRRQFLITLACEGGLPRALLVRDGVHLKVFYGRLLAEHERYPGTPMELLIERHERLLPQSLRNGIVRELSATLIDSVARLRRLVGSVDNPVPALDARQPGWRDAIPLRLSDDIALELLRGLLAQRAPERSAAEISLAAFLHDTAIGWSFARVADVPPLMSGADLAKQLSTPEDELPPGFVLQLRASDGTSYRIAVATKVGDENFRLETTGRSLPGSEPRTLDVLRLVAVANGREYGGDVPRGGERIDGVPWVFAGNKDGDDQYALIGVGSLRTRRAEVMVAAPEAMSVSATGSLEEIGRVGPAKPVSVAPGISSAPTVGLYKVYRLSGSADLGADDDTVYSIETKAEADVERSCVLLGERLSLGHGASEVWRGVPRVEVREGSIRAVTPTHDIEWRPHTGASVWRRIGGDCLGDVQLRVKRHGQVLARFRATVLPAATRIQLRPGTKQGRGTVIIEGAGVRKAAAGIGAGVTGEAVATGGRAEVELVAVDRVPATVPLWLDLDDGRRATLEVPFPAVAALFVDAAGNVVAPGAEVAVDSLVGMRVQVVTPSAGDAFQLTACLFGNPRDVADDAVHLEGIHARRRDLASLRRDELGRHVLLLEEVHDAIRELLAMSTDLDAVVELRVEMTGGSPTPATRRELRVKRYDAWFERPTLEEDAVWVAVHERAVEKIGKAVLENLRAEAFPIRAPDAARVGLERVEGRWKLPLTDKAPGPWFILGTQGNDVRFRPLLVTVPGDEEGAPSSMRAAMGIAEKGQRRRAIDESIAVLAQDGDHADWALLWHQLRQLDALPPTTYDSVDRLIRNMDAVALTMLSAPSSMVGTLYARLEELPFLWSLVPIRAWLHAVHVMRRKYESKSEALAELPGGWTGVFSETLRARMEQLTQRARWFQNVWDALAQLVPDLNAPGDRPVLAVKGGQSLVPIVENARHAMRRRHANDTYPQAELGAELDRVPEPYRRRLAHRAEPGCAYERDVFNAPLIAAAASVFGLELRRPAIFDIGRMRSFDRYGFEEAYEFLVAEMLGEEIRRQGGRFE